MGNKIEEVAKLLGVELEEEFRIGKNNRFKFTVNGLSFWAENHQAWVHYDITEQLLLGRYEIIKLPTTILDEKEKEYLSAVIKPFRDKVISIAKHSAYNNLSYIVISLKKYLVEESVTLPYFEEHKMYKNMKLDKVYTLEELGL